MRKRERVHRAHACIAQHLRQLRGDAVLMAVARLRRGAIELGRDGPTIREIAGHTGIGHQGVANCLLELARERLIEKRYGEPGGVRLTPEGARRARGGQPGVAVD